MRPALTITTIAAITAITALTATHTSADVLFSNFGPGDSYDTVYGWTLSYGGPLGGDAFEDAVPFTVTGGNYYFDSAEVAVNHFYGPDRVFFTLHADASGVPGAVLDQTSAGGTITPGTMPPPMLAPFGGDVILQNGQTYWLSLRTEETDAHLSWAYNVVDDFGLRAWQVNNGPWNPATGIPGTDSERAAFRINATPVPPPPHSPSSPSPSPPSPAAAADLSKCTDDVLACHGDVFVAMRLRRGPHSDHVWHAHRLGEHVLACHGNVFVAMDSRPQTPGSRPNSHHHLT
ncbi:MAG TPA: choice-of-anchor R domain-containing protein [Phycisphaerales bacterium]|nr:choice-of-anchor R domain-containing protein [Phycisphaerales bacterium]